MRIKIDKTIVGVVREMGRHKAPRQLAALLVAGVDPSQHLVLRIGRKKADVKSWHDIAKARRPGDRVYIEYLSLLAEPKGPDVPMPAMDLRDAIEEFERRGAVIIETSTGRSTEDRKQRKAMIADAVRSLGFGRALPSDVARAIGAKAGRRKRDLSPWRSIIEAEWDAVVRNPTYEHAIAAMIARGAPDDLSRSAVWRAIEQWRGRGKAGRGASLVKRKR